MPAWNSARAFGSTREIARYGRRRAIGNQNRANLAKCKRSLCSLILHPAPRLVFVRLELEVALARGVGRLSRLARAGGGTTLPGKLLAAVDRSAVDALAARLDRGCALVSA